MPPKDNEHEKIGELLKENNELLRENRKLIKKLYRLTVGGLWFRIFWYILLIGLPFAIYFYVLEPYFEAFGSNYNTFIEGLNELPGLKGIKDLINR